MKTVVEIAVNEPNDVSVSVESLSVLSVCDDNITILNDTALSILSVDVDNTLVISDCVGVQGPPGVGGSNDSVRFFVEAGFDILQYYVVAPRIVDDSVRVASNDDLVMADRPLWLALSGALAGEQLEVISTGRVDNLGWSWNQGPIYLGEDGQLTQVAPEPPALFLVQVGYAIGPTALFYERGSAVLLSN